MMTVLILNRFFWLIVFFVTALPLYGQDNASDFPLEVKADVITCEQEKNTCTAVTNVKVIYDEPDEAKDTSQPYHYTLNCDHLTVYFEKDDKDKEDNSNHKGESSPSSPLNGKKIHFMRARGHVVVVRTLTNAQEEPLIIHSDRATYDPKTEIIEFFDHVRIKDGTRAYSESHYASMNKKTGQYTISNTFPSKNVHDSKDFPQTKSGQTKLILNMKKS